MSIAWGQKFRAAGLHLGASALVLALAFGLIFLFWYPDPYFRIKGAGHIIKVLVAVDLVLGPLLTFVVYRRGKRGLTFDLTAIVAMQVVALAYGMHAIHEERPRFMVYAVDRFNVLAAKDVDVSSITDPAFLAKPRRGPLLVVALRPTDPEARQRLLTETLFEGRPDLEQRPEYWREYASELQHVLARARTVAELRAARPEALAAIDRALNRLGREAGRVMFVPVIGKNGDFAVFIDPDDGAVLDAVEVNPWLGAQSPDEG